MFGENKKIIGIWYIISFIALAVGVFIGAIYYVYNHIGSADIKNYLDGYTNTLRNGMNMNSIIMSTMKSYIFLFLCVCISGLFKLGPILSFFVLIRKGFVDAFTTSAMVDVYGFGGIILSVSSMIRIVVLIPVLCVLSAMSVFLSKNRRLLERRDKIIYIIFLVIVFTIFCGCALFEGILTTTFMKWLAFKVT